MIEVPIEMEVSTSYQPKTGSGSDLPIVTVDDNGKILKVINGEWNKGDETKELPDVTVQDDGKVLKVSNGAWTVGQESGGGSDLPSVTVEDNGEVLTVVDGEWAASNIPIELPAVSNTDNGKVLTVVDGEWNKANVPSSSDLPNVTQEDDGKILRVVEGEWAVSSESSGGLSNDVKDALLNMFQVVAYTSSDAQTYYDALEDALYPPVPVVSIEATFNQGQNIVYDDDSLTTLKQYLTVIGTQADSETIVIENYTLSGTLTVGTSTITVHYGDLTDTFNVTVTERLVPSGYTAYDYLTRSSEAVDYVETQITANPSMAIFDFECWFSAHDMSGNNGLMGNRSTGGAAANKNEFAWYICDSAKNACIRTSTFGTPVQDMGDYIDNIERHVKYYYNDGDSYVTIDNGSPIAITNAVPRNPITPPQTTYGLWLCNINAMGVSAETSIAKGLGSKVGRIIFYNAGTSVKLYDFIPAYNGTKYGFYERVNNVFYPQKNNVLIGGNY